LSRAAQHHPATHPHPSLRLLANAGVCELAVPPAQMAAVAFRSLQASLAPV